MKSLRIRGAQGTRGSLRSQQPHPARTIPFRAPGPSGLACVAACVVRRANLTGVLDSQRHDGVSLEEISWSPSVTVVVIDLSSISPGLVPFIRSRQNVPSKVGDRIGIWASLSGGSRDFFRVGKTRVGIGRAGRPPGVPAWGWLWGFPPAVRCS